MKRDAVFTAVPPCGTDQQLNGWAAFARRSTTPGEQTISFCGDCTPEYRDAMRAAGTCAPAGAEYTYGRRKVAGQRVWLWRAEPVTPAEQDGAKAPAKVC